MCGRFWVVTGGGLLRPSRVWWCCSVALVNGWCWTRLIWKVDGSLGWTVMLGCSRAVIPVGLARKVCWSLVEGGVPMRGSMAFFGLCSVWS